MRQFFLLILVVVMGSACDTPEEMRATRRLVAQEEIQALIFVRHEASGLCFATFGLGFNASVLAEVDCEEVKHLLVSTPSPK